MIITKPRYYDAFRCIAGSCPDSCCKEWAVQVDDDAASLYRQLPGTLGDRLREVLTEEDGETVMAIENGRCPMWREDGLCRIQAELGEEALCHVCREFPRLRHDYGDFVELGLELSCPEAARLILSAPAEAPIAEETAEDGIGDYDEEAMASLKASREVALRLLDESDPKKALASLLIYGYQAQAELDGEEAAEFDAEAALEDAAVMAKPGNTEAIAAFFRELEILTPVWKKLLNHPHNVSLPAQAQNLARYLVNRYWLQAVSDYDLTCRVKFIVIACLLVGSLGDDFCHTAQLFSKEIENDADNVDAILDAAYTREAFTDDKLLGLLLT